METNDRPRVRIMRGAMDKGCDMWAPIIPPSDDLKAESSATVTTNELTDAIPVPGVINSKVEKEI